MLTPHEFATLMLLHDAPDQIDMSRHELDALFERQLVTLEGSTQGDRRALVTTQGLSILEALGRNTPDTLDHTEWHHTEWH
jgi:hypothetical protein